MNDRLSNYKLIFEIAFIILFIIFLIYGSIFFHKGAYNHVSFKNLTPIVIAATSIIAAVFFTIKIYLGNQLSIKEKKMLKEYSDKVEEVKKDFTDKFAAQTTDMNTKLAAQMTDMDKKFAQQKAELTALLNELVATGKITVNKQG